MQTIDDILFSAPGPDPIPTATTEIVGTPGNALNVYWIVSHFPIGSVVSGPFPQKDSPNVLDDENYVHISWLPTLGALSYDLLFTRELQLPRRPGRFLLAANLIETEFRDTGQDLELYDLAGIPLGAPQEEHIYFNNRDFEQPTLQFIPWPIRVSSIIFEDGSSQNTAGGGGQPAPPNESIQFNNNGVFGGSPNLVWDQANWQLKVVDNTGAGIIIDNTAINANYFILFRTDSVERMRITPTGNVGIGTQNPQATLDVAGNISLSGDINSIISHPTTAADLYFNAGRDIWINARQIVLNNTNFLVAGSSTLNFNSSGSLSGTLGTVSLVTTGGMLFDSQDIIIFRVPSGLEVMRIQGSGILVQGDINLTGRVLINGVPFAAPYLSGPDIAVSNVTRIESPSSGVTVNAGANAIQFLFGASNTVILSSGFADFYGVFTRIFGLFQVQNALTVFDDGNIELTNLPSTSPGAGSKRIWYDPADGNIVKFAA